MPLAHLYPSSSHAIPFACVFIHTLVLLRLRFACDNKFLNQLRYYKGIDFLFNSALHAQHLLDTCPNARDQPLSASGGCPHRLWANLFPRQMPHYCLTQKPSGGRLHRLWANLFPRQMPHYCLTQKSSGGCPYRLWENLLPRQMPRYCLTQQDWSDAWPRSRDLTLSSGGCLHRLWAPYTPFINGSSLQQMINYCPPQRMFNGCLLQQLRGVLPLTRVSTALQFSDTSPAERWFHKRRMRRLFGPGYSSDDAGDGPSSDSEDEYTHDRSDDGSEESADYQPLLWCKGDIKMYLRWHDFSSMITQAYRRWTPEVAVKPTCHPQRCHTRCY